MQQSSQKEEFSYAYLHAVAATAGYAVARWIVDEDSIDCTVAARGGSGTVRSPKLDVQLKATAVHEIDGDVVRFPLKIKNYNELRPTDYSTPRILVLFLVPRNVDEWMAGDERAQELRHVGFWKSLRGEPDVDNTETVTVTVPISQPFTPDALTQIMQRLIAGGLP